jgi:hypothetical protein
VRKTGFNEFTPYKFKPGDIRALRKAGIAVYRTDEEAWENRPRRSAAERTASYANLREKKSDTQVDEDGSLRFGNVERRQKRPVAPWSAQLNDPCTWEPFKGKTAAQYFGECPSDESLTPPDWSLSAIGSELAHHWGWRAKNKSALPTTKVRLCPAPGCLFRLLIAVHPADKLHEGCKKAQHDEQKRVSKRNERANRTSQTVCHLVLPAVGRVTGAHHSC